MNILHILIKSKTETQYCVSSHEHAYDDKQPPINIKPPNKNILLDGIQPITDWKVESMAGIYNSIYSTILWSRKVKLI